MLLKKTILPPWIQWLGVLWGIILTLWAIDASADCPALNTSITHDLTASFCELCGTGEVTIRITHPDRHASLTQLVIREDLRSSGLNYVPGSTTFAVNYGSPPASFDPAIGGTVLTWDLGSYTLEDRPPYASNQYLEISFQVRMPTGSQEALAAADRRVQAAVDFTAIDAADIFLCDDSLASGLQELPINQPLPFVEKTGRNVDAAQSAYSGTVYGNNNDDVIWRIRVENQGSAGLQDLLINDVMDTGNLSLNFRCPNEAEAINVANNNGSLPSGSQCYAITGNSLLNFEVDNPYGTPSNDSPDLVDVPTSGSTDIFLVGKILTDGSCTGPRDNNVYGIQWGCEATAGDDQDAGGISVPASSNGITPAVDIDATAEMSTVALESGLNVTTSITGTNGSGPAGGKGRVRITITNNTGGTIKNIHLRDVLPSQYVVDYTYAPTVSVTRPGGYSGAYDGMIDQVTWSHVSTPSSDTDYTTALGNTAPEFDLTSTTTNAPYADQVNMLRHGDVALVTFRIVLVRPESYDKTADLDVRTEAPDSDPPDTDPDNTVQLTNHLYTDYEDFCTGAQQLDPYPLTTTHQSQPEDLDIDINGNVFILTDDHSQPLPLTVSLTNHGGHEADDYFAYVSFGEAMSVQTVPAGCSAEANPPPMPVWRLPSAIPASAGVYRCDAGAVAAGQTRSFTFQVIKNDSAVQDDLTFRADVIGEITLSDGTPLWFPAPTARDDSVTDRANNYSLDGVRARVIGFNLLKNQVGNCSENNPPTTSPDRQVQIGEECTYHIEAGGWFGFQTPGFTLIAVQDVTVFDQLPNGQGYIWSTPDPSAVSTSAIQSISLNPAGLAAPNEVSAPDYLNWTFNWGDGLRIVEKGHWFRADMTSRLLNDPQDASELPNRHAELSTNILNSTFRALFRNEDGEEAWYELNQDTVGYPVQSVRSIDLTVTEPDITVVKEVCNESLSATGTGPACTPFVALADDGDAYNNYVYRLTVTNEASSDGVTRAPAYDVTITDTLDGSDLAYVFPFAGDGLDNDGDGLSGAADTDGEGTIGDNTVKNGTPAQITFSYTHSDSLLRIDPGQSVQLFYRVDFDNDAAPLQTFTNTAQATYDSLEGDYGNMSTPQRSNGDIAGARVYTSPEASARVRIIPVATQPKQIADLSLTAPGGSPQAVSIGEEIEYRLNTLLPVALLRNFVIRDELPEGLRCSEAPAVNLDAAPYSAANFVPGGIFTPTCSDDVVEWNFGDQRVTTGTAGLGNRFDFEIGFIARVENTAATNDGNILSNGHPATSATATYIDETGSAVVLNFGQVDVQVREPAMALTKSFEVSHADAHDILTVTVTATNNGTATAYNLRVLDDLTGRNLAFIGNVGGSQPPDTVDTSTLGANRPIFSWNAPNGIAPNAAVSFTFEVQVDDGVQPLEILDNTIQADWTSLPGRTTTLNSTGMIGADGSADGMRIGALPNAGDAVNDYETSAGSQVDVPPLGLAKTDLDPAMVPAIGVHKSFTIDISLPEGVTHDVVVTDSLDAGGVSYVLANNTGYDISYTFQGIATINGQPPAEAAFNAFPADNTGGSAVWDIGTVVTQTENDPDQSAVAPLIRIHYYGRVNNDMVTDDGDTLGNTVETVYTHGETGGQETLADTTTQVTALEPLLTVIKTVSNVTPGKQPTDPPSGGDLLEYAVTVLNGGTATAFDVNLVDTLPSGLTLYTGFTPTATIGGTAVTGFTATPANAPNGPLIWGRDNGDGSLDIPAGQSLILTYRTVVQAAGGDLVNRVYVDWTSLDGPDTYERTGAGCPDWTAPNDYCAGPAQAATTTVDDNNIEKTIVADTYATPPLSTTADAVARVGDIVTYRLGLNLSGGLTRNLRVQDTLPGGMAFAGTVSINGDTTANYTPPASGAGSNFSYAPITSATVPADGQTGTLTWTIGDTINDPFGDPTTDTLEIVYRARIMPDAGIAQAASTTLTNTVDMDYDTAAGAAPTQSDSAALTVVQPVLTISKTAVAGGGDTVLAADEIVTYTVDIANTGDAPAYDALVTDIVPAGMRNGTATITVTEMRLLSGTVWPNLAPVYDAATGTATWDFDTGTADQYSIPPGDTLRIVYQLQTETGIGAGLTLTNQAQVQHYYSFDDEAVPTQDGITGEQEDYGPGDTASVTLTTAMPDPLLKENPAVPTVAVGEPFSYRVTVPATPQDVALHDVRILDDLSASAAGLSFVAVTKISGSQPWTPVNTGSATNLVIEDPTMGIDIPAGEQIVVEITVVLDDTTDNHSGLQFNNTATYTFNQVNDDPATQTDGGPDTTADMTIVGSGALTLQKSGPAIMQVGAAATFTLDVHNPGTGTAWNPTITDRLPHESNGGMCTAGPSNVIAQIFAADGVTPVSPVLVQGTDYTVTFNGEPDCQWTLSLLSPAGGIGADQHLIVQYDVELDPDTENGITLTNVAGATQWFSADPGVPGSAPHTYSEELTDGTPGTLDHEDSHGVTAEAPILEFHMSVVNVTTGQDPGSNASPGDTLHYTIQVDNNGPVGLDTFSIVDDLDLLNAVPAFASGSLNLVNVPAGADTSATDAAGGTHGTGLVNISNLTIGAQSDTDDSDSLVVEFEVTLAPAITSGTVVLNQAGLVFDGQELLASDDPNLPGDTDPTETLIASAPAFQVLKTSTIISGDPDVLMAGETLRYTLTIKNIGTEDAVTVRLRDYAPANTTYVPNSTTLNGVAVADPVPGVSPLEDGMLVNAPENTTAGYLRADADADATNVATVTFDVVVDPDVMDGLIIANQGFVNGSGAGSGEQPEQPSDDPGTPAPDDPTCNVVGNLPLLYAQKTVAIYEDYGSPGIVDPGDVLRYTIVINNFGAIAATNVVLTDAVPTDTTYVADSMRLNGVLLGTDGGISPLIAGLEVQSADNPGAGIISAGASAVVTFEARVNDSVPAGTLISNQGSVASAELPAEPTDADGVPSNGDQPTIIVVGEAQWITVTMEVGVVGGGAALAGGELEYVVRVTNVGSLPATHLAITDDLGPPLGDQVTYVDGSGTLNGAPAGISYAGGVLTADYIGQYGDLQPGAGAVLRFRVRINPDLTMGTTITNTGLAHWNDPEQTASASVSIDVGGTPGSASLNGDIWHDADLDKVCDHDAETCLEGWSVALYRNNQLVTTVTTDADGLYRIGGLVPNAGTSDLYELRFQAAGAGANTPSLGYADSPFTNGPQRISAITAASGANLQNLNLPLWPNGAVYDSVGREPVAGATVALLNAATGAALPTQCFDDAAQQNQITAQDGFYKFDLNFSDTACPAGGAYLISVTPPAAGYQAAPSQIIPPSSTAATAPFSVPACPGTADDAVPATTEYCEANTSATVPSMSVLPRTAGTIYHLHLTLSDGNIPGQSQIFNNSIPIDPVLDGAVAITKTSSLINVTKAALVPYTITVTNIYGAPLHDIAIVDRFPAGFKYVENSARLDGSPAEPRINGRELTWNDLDLDVNQKYTLRLLLVVGSGVSEGEYVNRAQVVNAAMGTAVSGEATATVRVVPDPDFDCTDVIGKVFDDRDLNGWQDADENGLGGVRVVTARGLIATSDEHGRFHITCAAVPDEDRGSNFILKLDERSLPSGYRLTTENPRVQRATRGKMLRFNFGATIHRVVRLDIADGVFEPDTSEMRLQWKPRIAKLLEELHKAPSMLRLSYLADVEREDLADKRLEALKREITDQWERSGNAYRLTVETEIFWRRGAPVAGR